jgi:hypothetical protein
MINGTIKVLQSLQVWIGLMKGTEPRSVFWHNLTALHENNMNSPWQKTSSRYNLYCLGLIDPLTYKEWLSKHYWD